MQGAIIKNYFADKIHEDPENIFSVSIMPCIAKKAECALPTMDSTGTGPDVDVVLNTREFVDYMKSLNIDVYGLPEDHFDSPCGEGTGAAVIFGTTGGVMEAALRSCYYLATGETQILMHSTVSAAWTAGRKLPSISPEQKLKSL